MSDKLFKILADFEVTKDAHESEELDYIEIQGYANTTKKDRMGDVIEENAWKQGGLDNYLKNPIVLAYHNHQRPIGKVVSSEVTSKGLKIVARISKKIAEIPELIKDGILKAFSVGFMVKDADYDSKTGIFVIKDLELFEISVVSVPANADSVFSVKKSFDTEENLEKFKKEVVKELEEEETIVEDTSTQEIESKLKEFQDNVVNLIGSLDSKIDNLKEKTNMADDNKDTKVEITTEGVEKLLKEVEDRLKAESTKSIEDLTSQLKEKSAEIDALLKNKMTFVDKSEGKKISDEEKDTAVLLGIITGKGVTGTRYGKNIIEKSGKEHWDASSDWEQEFSTRVWDAIRERLVLEPLFRNTVSMNTPTMHFPVNPEAGLAYWVPTGDFKNVKSSSETAGTHQIKDNTLIAYKLATKEFIGYEEEEDAIIAIMPIIREAVVRRMARSSDRAILRGQGASTAQPNYDPIKGLGKIAEDGVDKEVTKNTNQKVTVADLQSVRRKLKVYGLDPSDLVYVVSHDVYYDLLEDDDFRTVDLVGDRATVLRGQIGSCNGSPVVVSGEFAAKGNNEYGAVVVNQSNFILGTLKGLTVERDRLIESQQNLLVATRRLAFRDIIAGEGAACLTWTT